MMRFFPRGSISENLTGSILKNLSSSIFKNILIVACCVLACAGIQTSALAQHPGAHAGGGGHVGGGVRMSVPPRAPIPQPRVFGVPGAGPRGAGPQGAGLHGAGARPPGVGPGGFRFRQGPINDFHRRRFFGAPFFGVPFSRPRVGFRFGVGLGFNSLWWPSCGPSLGWGFDCYPVPFYGYGYGGYGYGGYGFENYVTPEVYESPVYVYGGEGPNLIWLYLKDGSVYGVTDYWLVDDQMHFSLVEDDPRKPAEHMIPLDELDLPKTIDVNTRRGFRIVFRDEPWQEYLKHHPDLSPPDLPPPQN